MVLVHAQALSDSPGLILPLGASGEISGAGGTEASVECAHILMKRI
jgi:hypothetical protein